MPSHTPRPRVNLPIWMESRDKLKKLAELKGQTMTQVLDDLLTKALEDESA